MNSTEVDKIVKAIFEKLEYELKFKMIPERLYTPQARVLAAQRLAFMKEYF